MILFRYDANSMDEFRLACDCCDLPIYTQRASIPSGALVFGRYSVLPYYRELAADLRYCGSRLVNSAAAHDYIAQGRYYHDVSVHTFRTWTAAQFVHATDPGPFVVKGATNSRKHHWDTMMFAKDKAEAIQVMTRLQQDALIGSQPIIFRKYVPLETFEIGLNGVRFTNEYRFFFLGERLLAGGYYWSESRDAELRTVPPAAEQFARKIARIISNGVPFFVLDVAEKESGGWILVEVNDAQCSGLSMIGPAEFYTALCKAAVAYCKKEFA